VPAATVVDSVRTVADYFKKKVLILGDGAVGKTSLIRRFVVDEFKDDYITTIGTKTTKKDLVLDAKGTTWNLSLMIWDVLGQKGYTEVQTNALHGAKGVVLVYDASRPETRGALVDYWIPRVWKVAGKLPMVIFANKADLAGDSPEPAATLQSLCSVYGCEGFLTSAKTGQNVEAAFGALGMKLIAAGEAGPHKAMDVLVAGDVDDALVSATDRIIADFCKEFGDVETAMPIVKHQFTKAGVDVKEPTKDALLRALHALAEIEHGYKSDERVSENLTRRSGWVRKAN